MPEAIWFPDLFGDGFQDDELEVIENGGDTVFFYFEDYIIINQFDGNRRHHFVLNKAYENKN